MATARLLLSAIDPNLQNIPIRTDLGREIRKGFVAAPDTVFLAVDYSQIELRVLAHIVDMHQVAKQPEGIMQGDKPDETQTTKTLYDLNRYLNYCIELLAVVSKVAALYVQDFPDSVAVSAVDSVESLCGGLSNKIWQKLQAVDQLQNAPGQ